MEEFVVVVQMGCQVGWPYFGIGKLLMKMAILFLMNTKRGHMN